LFYLSYLAAEVRRRFGRTLLTALGLAIGVALVVAVSALSRGLDDAQTEVLRPLTGLGTDMAVTRPLRSTEDGEGFAAGAGGLLQLTPEEIERLQDENQSAIVDPSELGEPGDEFESDIFVTTTQLSFPEREVEGVRALDGVQAAAPTLTLSLLNVTGEVPERGFESGAIGPGATAGSDINFDPSTISGIDRDQPDLGLVTPAQLTQGNWFAKGSDGRGEAIVTQGYSGRKGITIGSEVAIRDAEFEVVGIAEPPLGGSASDVYIDLPRLQELSDRTDRVNGIQVRAEDSDAVAGVAAAIEREFEGAAVTTASDLADQVSGSLLDAQRLADNLSLALAAVALLAAFLIAMLLTLTGVNKRTRELGTLSALGWSKISIVRQVAGEAVLTGVIGGLVGAGLGALAAFALDRSDTQLTASVGGEQISSGPLGFGQGQIVSGSSEVSLGAPLSPDIIVMAVVLAILGGLLAGLVGGWRAARLRPVDALRHVG
jgi:ABC-type antimicrobial peptide transport system permease subunit